MPVWPVFPTTVSISGKEMSFSSTFRFMARDWGSEIPGANWTSMSNAPSSMIGMNSVPKRGIKTADPASKARETAKTVFL